MISAQSIPVGELSHCYWLDAEGELCAGADWPYMILASSLSHEVWSLEREARNTEYPRTVGLNFPSSICPDWTVKTRHLH